MDAVRTFQNLHNEWLKIFQNWGLSIFRCEEKGKYWIIRRKIASPLASLHEKQRTQIQDMLPQQY